MIMMEIKTLETKKQINKNQKNPKKTRYCDG